MKTIRQIKYFAMIGTISVLIDYIVYRLLLNFISNVQLAKFCGFAFGTVFSFTTNRNLTFNVKNNFLYNLIKFTLLYMTSMVINISVNAFMLDLITDSNLKVQISFTLATLLSATLNFVGMKLIVFK